MNWDTVGYKVVGETVGETMGQYTVGCDLMGNQLARFLCRGELGGAVGL